MEIRINGENKKVAGPLTVAELLKELAVDPDTVIVERNLDILNRENHEAQPLEDGDTLEIIQMVSGG